jgi:hypothetical protein
MYQRKEREKNTGVYCIVFGCGKELKGFELLAGNKCFKCQQKTKQNEKTLFNMGRGPDEMPDDCFNR